MKNMGLSRLRLVGPPPTEEGLVRARAVHAGDIWERVSCFDTLSGAAADCSLLVGTTRRRGRRRKNVTMDPRTLAAWLRNRPGGGQVALVFGNERTGLEDAELDLCNAASHIPVSEAFPSLNLSHAVQVYAYELFLALGQASAGADGNAGTAGGGVLGGGAFPAGHAPVKGAWVPLNRAQVEELAASITDTLAGLGFYKHPGREMQTRFLQDLISRAGLASREGKYLADIFAKAARLGARRAP
jgi:tRNA/rRNA methyltransferase/tRNA (cytidine32/uridine32-2'-O)-methyltransferase